MKLSPWVISLLGVFIFLMCVAYGFVTWSPNMTETKLLRDNTDALTTEGNKQGQAEKRVKKAEADVAAEAEKWRAVVAVHTPPASVADGGIDISENGWQLVVDAPKFRNSVQRDVNAQVKRGGVKVLSGPQIPAPSDNGASILADYFNYPAIAFPVVIYDLGTIQVQGTYDQIMANVRSYSSMPRYLAVVDGLRIEGTSPGLRATYNLSIVGYIRGNRLFTSVPETASTASTGAGGPGGFGPGAGRGRGGPAGGGPAGFGSPAGGPPGGNFGSGGPRMPSAAGGPGGPAGLPPPGAPSAASGGGAGRRGG